MRSSTAALCLGLLLVACGPSPSAPPAPVQTTPVEPAPEVSPPRIAVEFDGLEAAFAARRKLLETAEDESSNPRFGAPMEEVEEGVAAFGGASGGAPASAEEDEENPRFGGASPSTPADSEERRSREPGVDVNLDPTSDYAPQGEGVAYEDGPPGDDAQDDDSVEDFARAPKRTTWRRSSSTPNATRLAIGDDTFLPLEAMQIQVRVDGFRARVVLDCLYRNTFDRQLEGTFSLRLPSDAAPDYLAFGKTVLTDPTTPLAVLAMPAMSSDWTSPTALRTAREPVWTAPREARMVTRELAARAYTETVAREVDPALLEWSGAGVFSARVFPLEPEVLHRIVVAYHVPLTATADGHEFRLDIPEGVPRLTLNLAVTQAKGYTAGLSSSGGRAEGRDGRLSVTLTNPDPGPLFVRCEGDAPQTLTGADESGAYFATTFRPDLPAESASPGPGRAVFLLDTSNSSRAERMNIWLDILAAVLTESRGDIREFAVLTFDVQQDWWRQEWTPNTAAAIAELTKDVRELALEGATDLAGALRVAARHAPGSADSAPAPFDLFLLSDGGVTWGETDHAALAAELLGGRVRSLFAYDTGQQGTDLRTLSGPAQATGGAVFSVPGASEVQAAATAHRKRPWRVDGVTATGCDDVLLAGRPRFVYPGQTLVAAGRGSPTAGATLSLALSRDDGRTSEVVRTPLDRALASPLTPRVFGEIAVGQLEQLGDLAREDAAPHARHFRVVGTTCSLVMLESEEDYERYGIDSSVDSSVDVETVRASRVDELVRGLEDEALRRVTDPAARFRDWIERMARTGGLRLDGVNGVAARLERLPPAAFGVVPEPLKCSVRSWDQVPGPLHEELAGGAPGYDALVAEAERRRSDAGPADSLRALSTLVEAQPGNIPLTRDVAYSALTDGFPGHAYELLRRAATQRPFEPHGFLAMAECLGRMGRDELAQVLVDATLDGEWPNRFGNWPALAHQLRPGGATLPEWSTPFAQPGDLLVAIEWNTDRTDVDLHVIDPAGETCYYGHQSTAAGGVMSTDVTQGYGPELFAQVVAGPGEYLIAVKYFAGDRLRTGVRTKVRVTILTDVGTDAERVYRHTVTLGDESEFHPVARVVVRK